METEESLVVQIGNEARQSFGLVYFEEPCLRLILYDEYDFILSGVCVTREQRKTFAVKYREDGQ